MSVEKRLVYTNAGDKIFADMRAGAGDGPRGPSGDSAPHIPLHALKSIRKPPIFSLRAHQQGEILTRNSEFAALLAGGLGL